LQLLSERDTEFALATSRPSARGFDFARHKKWSANNHRWLRRQCYNDAGIGMASALGVSFLNEFGDNLLPIGDHLSEIKTIDQVV